MRDCLRVRVVVFLPLYERIPATVYLVAARGKKNCAAYSFSLALVIYTGRRGSSRDRSLFYDWQTVFITAT